MYHQRTRLGSKINGSRSMRQYNPKVSEQAFIDPKWQQNDIQVLSLPQGCRTAASLRFQESFGSERSKSFHYVRAPSYKTANEVEEGREGREGIYS